MRVSPVLGFGGGKGREWVVVLGWLHKILWIELFEGKTYLERTIVYWLFMGHNFVKAACFATVFNA